MQVSVPNSGKQYTLLQRTSFMRQYLADRERGRTDLLWLCNEVFGYKDVRGADPGWENVNDPLTGENHQPLLDGLHHFAGRREVADVETMQIVESVPRVAMYDQQIETLRNRLFLYPRDHLKTTVVTIAHSIQWVLNYEDVRILLSFSSGEHADRIVTAILGHFRYNKRFRFLYPEFCPPAERSNDFGSLKSFTVPNRTRLITEPTMMAVTVGKIIAGTHQDVHFHSDLVDKENVKTVTAIKDVNDHFGYTDPLLARIEGRQGWRYVEGTRYDFSDLYGVIKDSEEGKPVENRQWIMVERSAEVSQKTGKVLWPKRYTWDSLQKIKHNPTVGVVIYEAQYNQRCVDPKGGICTVDKIKWVQRDKVRKLMPYYRIHTTVDLAGMEERSIGAYCALTTCGFLPSGFIHVIDIRHGHFTPFEVIEHFFDIQERYRPRDFKMEKNHHAQVLEPFLRQEMTRRGIFLNVLNVPRDTSISKDNRISGLQSWFAAKRIWFVDDLPCDGHLVLEITRFPRYKYKDILDTLADQLQHADGKGIEPDLYPMPKDPEVRPWWEAEGKPKFQGFDPFSHEARFSDDVVERNLNFHRGTGL